MKNSKRYAYFSALLTIIYFTGSLPCAGSDFAFTYRAGPDKFQSYDYKAAIDIPKLPLQLDLNYGHQRSDGAELLTETGAGLTWSITDWASTNFRYLTIKEDLFELTGQEYGASFYLNPLWKSNLNTRLDIGLGDYAYDPQVRPALQALIAARVPDQRRYSVGLSQNLTEDVYVLGNYDEYRYNTDPVLIAALLLRRFRQPTNAAATLVSFPKYAYGVGLGWDATDSVTLNLSYSKNNTVIGQTQDSQRLGLSYHWNDALTLNAGITLSYSDAVVRNGITAIQASDSTILEFGVSYTFPD